MFSVRPLRSTVVTRFVATMQPTPTPTRRRRTVIASRTALPSPLARHRALKLDDTARGLPGSSTALCVRAVSTHPGRRAACWCFLLQRRCQASPTPAGGPSPLVSRGRLEFAYATARTLAARGFVDNIAVATHARLATCQRSHYRVRTFHPTRSARLILAHRSTRRKGRRERGMKRQRMVTLSL